MSDKLTLEKLAVLALDEAIRQIKSPYEIFGMVDLKFVDAILEAPECLIHRNIVEPAIKKHKRLSLCSPPQCDEIYDSTKGKKARCFSRKSGVQCVAVETEEGARLYFGEYQKQEKHG